MTDPDSLRALLDVVPTSQGTWRCTTASGSGRPNLFGGLVAAQALRAGHQSAGLDRFPHSLHAYFLRSGRHGAPLDIAVDPSRDGRSFTARRIEVSQGDGPILSMLASYQVIEQGDDYGLEGVAAEPPGPGAVTRGTGDATGAAGDGPFEMVELTPGVMRRGSLEWSAARYWARAREALPDDTGFHAAAVVAMGDLRTGSPVAIARSADGPYQMTSIDYAMWFRQPCRADDWLLYDLRPAGNGGARGLTVGTVHDATGRHVASLAMELLLRDRTAGAPTRQPKGA